MSHTGHRTRSWTVRTLAACTFAALPAIAIGQSTAVAQLLPPVAQPAPVPGATQSPGFTPPATTLPSQSSATGMSLDGVIATVLTSDPRLRVGNEEIKLAVADAITASLKPNPTLGLDGQLLPLTRPFTVQEQGGPPQFDAIVSYPIDWFLFGKRKAAMASTAVGIRQTESEYYNLIRNRVRDASLYYFDVLELKALRDVAQQDVDNLTNVETVIRRAVVNGGRPEVDANRVRLDLLKSQQALRDAETQLANAKARLRAYLGRTDNDPSFDVGGSLDLPASPPSVTFEEAHAIAEQNRPDLAALQAKVARAEANAAWEHKKAYPDLIVKAGYSRQFQGSIGFRDADAYLVGVDVALPFFDRNQGNRAKAASLVVQSRYEVAANQVEISAEIEQALNDYRNAQQSAQAVATDQLKLADQVRTAMNKANEAGGRPLLDVLDAQRNYRETYRLYVNTRANYWRSATRLNAALGKKMIP